MSRAGLNVRQALSRLRQNNSALQFGFMLPSVLLFAGFASTVDHIFINC